MIRTRFAPSPTGFLHIGGLRTALFAYLFAKKNKGKFILRIEDTDQSREVVGAKEEILTDLTAVGIYPDESYQKEGDFGPYIQSQRKEIYQKHAAELVAKDHAYCCFCTPERLAKMRLEQTKKKLAPRYDGSCRKLMQPQIKEKLAKNIPYTIRLKVRRAQGSIVVKDLLRGMVLFKSSQVDDQVLLKSDGLPTYHLACVVDDHLMQITHVIRGEEWLASTPKHLLLYEFFGWQTPEFIHLPLLLSTTRSKLSKRHGDVAVKDYLAKGFLTTALINFIALLGWNPGNNREIFCLEELIQEFSTTNLGKAGAVFDIQKLQWMNQQYIQKLTSKEFIEIITPFISPEYCKILPTKLEKMLLASQGNLNQLNSINEELNGFTPSKLNQKSRYLLQSEQNQKLLASFLSQIKLAEHWQKIDFLQTMQKVQKQTAIKGKELWMPLRLALTAKEQGPELALIAEILGKKFCREQVEKLIKN